MCKTVGDSILVSRLVSAIPALAALGLVVTLTSFAAETCTNFKGSWKGACVSDAGASFEAEAVVVQDSCEFISMRKTDQGIEDWPVETYIGTISSRQESLGGAIHVSVHRTEAFWWGDQKRILHSKTSKFVTWDSARPRLDLKEEAFSLEKGKLVMDKRVYEDFPSNRPKTTQCIYDLK